MRERLFRLLQHYVFFSKGAMGGWMSKRERAACEKKEIYKIQFPVLHVMDTNTKYKYYIGNFLCIN
jgi:hypothetical protein